MLTSFIVDVILKVTNKGGYKMNEYKFYRIKNKEGKFSTGGRLPTFTKSGKSWNESNFKRHLDILSQHNFDWSYEDCTVEEYTFLIDSSLKNPQFKTMSQLFEYKVKDVTDVFFKKFKGGF